MERRRFIGLGTAAGVGSVAALGRSAGSIFNGNFFLNQSPRIAHAAIKDYLARVDHGLAQIDEWRMEKVLKPENNHTVRDWSLENKLVRASLKTLFLTGMFADLPDEAQVHPEVQDLMWRNMSTMDQAVFGTTDYLKSLSPSQNAELKLILAKRNNPGMQVAEQLDVHMRALGMSLSRRMQTRNLFAQTSFRLAHQDPATVFQEYTAKVEKMAARHGSSEEMQRRLAARVSKEMFWEKQQHFIALANQWESSGEGIQIATGEAAAAKDMRQLSSGGSIMGIGAIIGGAGAILVMVGVFPGVFAITVGAVILVIGLIVAIIEGISKSGKS